MSEKMDEPVREYNTMKGTCRDFLKQSTLLPTLAVTPASVLKASEQHWDDKFADFAEKISVSLEVNGVKSASCRSTGRINICTSSGH